MSVLLNEPFVKSVETELKQLRQNLQDHVSGASGDNQSFLQSLVFAARGYIDDVPESDQSKRSD